MPIYEYKCKCGNDGESLLPLREFDQPQTCECGEVMQRKMSVCSFVIKQTGNQMALDTLNDGRNGMPDKHWKPMAEKYAATGL